MPEVSDSSADDATVEADFARLIASALHEAERLIQQFSEFYPFGTVITTHGEEERVMALPPGSGDYPAPADVRDALWDALRARRDGDRAAAVIANVTAADGSDAVRIELEHGEGVARAYLFTYRRRLLTRRFRYLQQHVDGTRPRIW